jgi:large-conductance mechanosensitive channel
MVDLSGGGQDGHIEHKFSDWIFVGPAILVIALVSFFARKLIQSLQEKERKREEKKKAKLQKKEGSSGTAGAKKKK